jgi:uncharacterized protein YfaS (alpha-2-macroglobulin family)
MLRPLEWTERYEGVPGLALELGVFSASGDQVFTGRATEESAGLYRVDVSLEEDLAGEHYILRWRLYAAPHTVLDASAVFVTGERLPESAVTILNS